MSLCDDLRDFEHYEAIEERFVSDLRWDGDFSGIAPEYGSRFAAIVSEISSPMLRRLLIDLTCSVNCICLMSWRNYVRNHWRKQSPRYFVNLLEQLPKVTDYLRSIHINSVTIEEERLLAREESIARNEYADGLISSTCINVSTKESNRLLPPLNIAVQCDADAIKQHQCFSDLSSINQWTVAAGQEKVVKPSTRFPLLQRFRIGRQYESDPEQISTIYGDGSHRLVIAGKYDYNTASREQLELVVLTPEILYLKNTSNTIPVYLQSPQGAKMLNCGIELLHESSLTIHCKSLHITISRY